MEGRTFWEEERNPGKKEEEMFLLEDLGGNGCDHRTGKYGWMWLEGWVT